DVQIVSGAPFLFPSLCVATALMNIILLTAEDFCSPTCAVITDPLRTEHIFSIHRAQVGDQLKLGLINGNLGQGKILFIETKRIVLGEIILDQPPPPPLPLTVLLGLPRPKMLKRILQTVATLG